MVLSHLTKAPSTSTIHLAADLRRHVSRMSEHRQLGSIWCFHRACLLGSVLLLCDCHQLHAPSTSPEQGPVWWMDYGKTRCSSQHLRSHLQRMDDGILLLRKSTTS
jgi:hypothetical protein